MDRTHTKASPRPGFLAAVALLALIGPGCARMRTYRAQNSPLPGLPLLGRVRRSATPPPAAFARNSQPPAGALVAWSGEPNTAAPVARLNAPRELPRDPVSRPPTLAAAPASGPSAAKPVDDPALAKIRSLVQTGRGSLGKIRTYQVAMSRQERVGETLLPSEDVLLSIRREPRAVRLEWPTGSHKGREVIYSTPETGGMMQINMADSIVPMPRMTLAPDSPMVMKNSRHPITEAGLDAILDRLEATLKPHESGTAGADRLFYDGEVTPPEIGRPCDKVAQVNPAGETWVILLDRGTGIPTFVQGTAKNGDLLERYVFKNLAVDPPTLADATAFDPDKRWGASRGLFGRLAQGAAANPTTR